MAERSDVPEPEATPVHIPLIPAGHCDLCRLEGMELHLRWARWLCWSCVSIVELQRETAGLRVEFDVLRATAAEAQQYGERHHLVLLSMQQLIEDRPPGPGSAEACLHYIGAMLKRLLSSETVSET